MKIIFLTILFIFALSLSAHATLDMAREAGLSMNDQKETEVETLKGKVLETMDAGGYTYLNLDLPGGSRWIAIPETSIRVGEVVEVQKGIEMGEHFSKSLQRKFPSIIFSGGVVGEKPKEDPDTAKRRESAHALAGIDTAKGGLSDEALKSIMVDKAGGDNAYTVEELVTKRKELAGRQVRVRGKVVKVSKGIMGRNWFHFRDGTGSADAKTNDITVTGKNLLLVGDTMVATGTLAIDKDFGGGYYYDVIIEDATFAEK